MALGTFLKNLSVRNKLYLLVGILVLNLASVISISVVGMGILSQVRAYVGGEGLWAKAQKNAIYSLSKYALSGREKDYQDYLSYLKTPLGDRKARIELSKPDPDLKVSDLGFLEGQNHPADVRGMARLFLRFHNFKLIHRAIEIWTQADAELVELQVLGERFHALSQGERTRPGAKADFIRSLDALNERLTVMENDFSFTMGQAARWAQALLVWVMVLGSIGIGALSVAIALRFSGEIVSGINRIGEAAFRASKGDLSTRVELDTTDELGQLGHAFNAMTESLSRIEKLKNNFVANVSHELRTPLTLNLAPLESLLDGDYGPVPEAQRSLLMIMYNNAMRLLQMVNGLLDFSKLEAGRMQVVREPIDVIGLTNSVVDDIRPAMAGKGVRIATALGEGRLVVQMDRYLYERILFNLLSNALKFTPKGGSVEIGLRYDGGLLRLEVKDSGIGISEADLNNLFKKFSQAEASSTRRFEGTGLGLAIVKECAQLLDGTATVQSRLGEGSVFCVVCRASQAPEGVAGEAQVQSAARRPAPPLLQPAAVPVENPVSSLPKLLVAEDNPELAKFIVSLLSGLCQVRVCTDGEEALREARAWIPDLVLSDVMMPKMDGLNLTRELKKGPKTAAIPVVLLTALTRQQDLLGGWEAGADDYLFKPFHPKELQARVRTLLTMVAWRQRSEAQHKRQEILELFANIASHDLKAPLRRICSYAELMLLDGKDSLDAQGRDYLQVILNGASQMYRLIESLIQFSHLESVDSAFQICDLSALVEDVLAFLEPFIMEQKASIDVGPLPKLKVVPEQIFALFQNLISNSLKYHSPWQSLGIEIRAKAQGHDWLFSVTDNGIGFDPEHREAVFVMFKRLQEKGEVPGEGMGLAIAKKIVEIHGGRIWAESASMRGCSIYFTLPDAFSFS
jgi:signal transduction histidine kinase